MNNDFKARGGRWVAAQFILFPFLALLALLERLIAPLPIATSTLTLARMLGAAVGLVGIALLVTAFKHLGRNLTAYPKPIDDGELTERGTYSIVRHPIYSGVILCVAAWALVTCTISGAFAALIAFVFFDRKAAFEERFLINKYTGYAAYRQRVKKLIPFVY